MPASYFRQGFLLITAWILATASCSYNYAAYSPTGTWKLIVCQPTSELELCLIRIVAEDNQQYRATVIAQGVRGLDLVAEKVSKTDKRMTIDIKMGSDVYKLSVLIPTDRDANRTELYGSFGRRPDVQFPAILQKTQEQNIDPKKGAFQSAANEAFLAVLKTANLDRQIELLRDLLKKHSDHPVAIYAGIELIDRLGDLEGHTKEIQTLAEAALKLASRHGPALAGQVAWRIGSILLASSKAQGLAYTYLERAARILSEEAPASFQVRLYKALAKAYRASNQAAQAEALFAKIEALERRADEEYRREIPPFSVKPVPPRPEPVRPLVLELFTGTQCPPCVAADVAFDALGQTYPESELILLQYHLHIPRADPLTNPDAINRSEFYQVRGTPTAFLNGKPLPGLGGPLSLAEARYKSLMKFIEDQRHNKPLCRIELKVHRQEKNLDIEATVSDHANLPEKARLILVLVEGEVRYAAPNGVRFHHHVVRAFPGGLEGISLGKERTHHKVRVNLADLETSLRNYLNDYAREEPFPDDEYPLELRKLKIVALVQDMESREIFHAVIAQVPE
ncbi:MAG: hypothetical protein RMI91_01550 [Gemmatales bacterium]|nr:hypothetical protein [Gemmatales bacterium]MDW7993311.1 hypothetical protein [Gemmatales bacterium]